MPEQAVAVDVRVHGRVQGVFFRAHTRAQARRLGVHGWVRNDDDGTVSAHLEGSSEAVEAMPAWCARGPERARVDRVERVAAVRTGATGFEVVEAEHDPGR